MSKRVWQVKIKGLLDSRWSDWFDGWTVIPQEDGTTLLTGPPVDQAGLHGVLVKIRDLNMELVSVCCCGQENEGPVIYDRFEAREPEQVIDSHERCGHDGYQATGTPGIRAGSGAQACPVHR